MDNLKITLFWRDNDWMDKNHAEHIWLHIYPAKKTYKIYTSMYCDIGSPEVVEIKTKSDIENMVKYLDNQDFVQEAV